MNKLFNRLDFQFFLKLMAVSFTLFLIFILFVPKKSVSRPFFNGETLLPDYSHNDTLIVNDAGALNYIFNDSKLPIPATDGEINEVLHRYCIPVSGHLCRWALCPYKGIKPAQYKDSVLKYTQAEEGSEAVQVDLMHLITPDADYDSIIEMIEED